MTDAILELNKPQIGPTEITPFHLAGEGTATRER